MGRLLALSSLIAIVIGGLLIAGSAFMIMLPALVLLAPLMLGRYLGEGRILRLRRAIASRRLRPSAAPLDDELRAGHALLVRGGRLIATSIAVRPPPHLV